MHHMGKVFFLLSFFAAGVARGQADNSPLQWKAVEGIYRLAGNPNMFIKFTDRNGELVARFLWDATAEIFFLPDSGLVFEGTDEGERGRAHIRFAKDSEGRVEHVTMGNGTEWYRVNRVVLGKGKLKAFAGSYQSTDDGDNRITVTPGDSVLVISEEWSGRRVVMTPLSETFFFSAQPEYTLQFLVSDEGGTPKAFKVLGRYTFLLTGK